MNMLNKIKTFFINFFQFQHAQIQDVKPEDHIDTSKIALCLNQLIEDRVKFISSIVRACSVVFTITIFMFTGNTELHKIIPELINKFWVTHANSDLESIYIVFIFWVVIFFGSLFLNNVASLAKAEASYIGITKTNKESLERNIKKFIRFDGGIILVGYGSILSCISVWMKLPTSIVIDILMIYFIAAWYFIRKYNTDEERLMIKLVNHL